MSVKRKALRRTKTLRRDTENMQPIHPSKISRILASIKAPFTKVFWEDMMEKTDNETLVDLKVLSYAYLEAGFIEAAAGFVFRFRHVSYGC